MHNHHNYTQRPAESDPQSDARDPAWDLEDFWLDDSVDDPTALTSVLTLYPNDTMEIHEVSSLVNSIANTRPEGITAVA